MNRKTLIKLAVISIALIQMSMNGISPIIASLAAAFPGTDIATIQYLITLPSLLTVPASFVSGLAIHRGGSRLCAVLGCSLILLSGMISFFFHSHLAVLFADAVLLGIGIGLSVPVGTALIVSSFTGSERSGIMGIQTSAANVGMMVMTFAGGLLATRAWSLNYLVYLLAIPGIVFSFLAIPEKKDSQEAAQHINYQKLAGKWRPILYSMIIPLLFNLIPANISLLLAEKKIGSAALSGTASTVLMLFGTLAGLAFGWLRERIGERTLPLGFVCLAAGLLVMACASHVTGALVGCAIAGVTVSWSMPALMLDVTEGDTPEEGATSSSALIMFSYLGGFFTPQLTRLAAAIPLFSNGVSGRFLLGALLAAVAGITAWFYTSRTRRVQP